MLHLQICSAELCFREKFGENLPSNWQELVENCPRIIKDRVVNGLLILLPNKEVCREILARYFLISETAHLGPVSHLASFPYIFAYSYKYFKSLVCYHYIIFVL